MSRPLRFESAYLLYINVYGVSEEQKPRILCRFETIDGFTIDAFINPYF
jgi:hypothetical protein